MNSRRNLKPSLGLRRAEEEEEEEGRAGAGEPNEIKCHPPGQTPRHGAESQVLNMRNGPTLTPSTGDINSFVKRRERESQVINIRLMLPDHESGNHEARGSTK